MLCRKLFVEIELKLGREIDHHHSSVSFEIGVIPFIRLSIFYPTALKGCRGIVFTHGVQMGGRVGGRGGNSLSRLYLRNRKV